MTHDERSLLIATARVLRAQIKSRPHLVREDMEDISALTDALKPFESSAKDADEKQERKK